MLDPISDMITRIRNAVQAGHSEVTVPFSNFKKGIAEILKKKKFIDNYDLVSENQDRKKIRIFLRYLQNDRGPRIPHIQGIRQISKQGQRIYAGKGKLPFVKGNFGFAIISTSKGLMTNEEARKTGVGGEIICEVW